MAIADHGNNKTLVDTDRDADMCLGEPANRAFGRQGRVNLRNSTERDRAGLYDDVVDRDLRFAVGAQVFEEPHRAIHLDDHRDVEVGDSLLAQHRAARDRLAHLARLDLPRRTGWRHSCVCGVVRRHGLPSSGPIRITICLDVAFDYPSARARARYARKVDAQLLRHAPRKRRALNSLCSLRFSIVSRGRRTR